VENVLTSTSRKDDHPLRSLGMGTVASDD
jgi:hypothetical protein